MDNVDTILKSALEGLGVPVERLQMQKKDKPETYITYQLLYSRERAHADDDNEAEEIGYRVDIYAKADYIALLINLKQALKAAGFFGTSVDPEMFERDTGYYHIPIETKIITEV